MSGPRQEPRPLSFPEPRLQVVPWRDEVIDRHGHDLRSSYVERFWLPVVGPSVVLFLRRMAADLEHAPDGIEIQTAEFALELGLGVKGGRHGPLWRAIERACRFGAASRNGQTLAVRLNINPLSPRQIERLPPALRLAHPRHEDAQWPDDAA